MQTRYLSTLVNHRFLALTLVLFCFLFSPFHVKAIGISPGNLILSDILPRSTVPVSIFFSRSHADSDENVQVTIQGDISNYLKPFKPLQGNMVVFPKGQNEFEFKMEFRSGNLADGSYTGTITVAQLAPDPLKNPAGDRAIAVGSTTLSGARASVVVNVKNQAIEAYNIVDVTLTESEANQPIGFSFRLNNTGNVDTKIGAVSFKINNKFNLEEKYEGKIDTSSFKLVTAFTSMTQTAFLPLKLNVGVYLVEFTLFDKNQKTVFVTKPLHLQIVPEGTLAQKGELTSLKIDGIEDNHQYQIGELLKFVATFKNTGSVGLRTAFTIEIFKDNKRVDLIKSEQQFVPINQSVDFENTFKITEGGTYKVKGYASYGIAKTKVMEINLQVGQFSLIFPVILLSIGSISMISGAVLYKRKRKVLP